MSVDYQLRDEAVALVTIDDGRVNALSHDVLDALHEALDRARKDEAKALVLAGRPGRFSAGFDLSVMGQDIEAVVKLVSKGADLGLRLCEWPAPVVLGVTGHAVAMGAVLLLTGDERIGAEGAFKIGLNEVAIGMTLPHFAYELARDRLSRRHFHRATTLAEIYSPESAVDAGYLDRLVPPDDVIEAAVSRAAELAGTLHAVAFRKTKEAIRGELVARLRREIDGSLAGQGG